MSQVKRWTDAAAFALVLLIAVQLVDGGFVPLPDFIPDPAPEPQPIDAAFPDGTYRLLVCGDQPTDGTAAVAQADNIRKEPGLERRWADYEDTDIGEPWQAALAWAEKKSGGKPYFVARKGRRTAHGPLIGDFDAMHKTLTDALEGLR